MRETTKKITGGNKTTFVGGKITKTTGGNYNIWGERITYNAGGTITMTGEEKGVSFGEYVPIQDVYTMHPNVEKVEFVDDKGNILNQNTKDFYYGRKIKIRVITKNAKNGDLLYVTLKGITKSKNQKFDLMNSSDYRWSGKPIFDNQYETPLFEFNTNWYSDDFEYYNYDEHKTKIKEEDLNEFYVHAIVDASSVYLPVKGERLKPVSYKRNYEELIGLFNTDNTGAKDLLTNYENKFIDSVKDFKTIVDDFSEYINEDNRDLTIDQIRTQVLSSAKKLWDEAVWQVQGHNLTTKNKDPKTGEEKTEVTKVQALLDDRPLYWARLAMQVILKRHPVFEKDIDLEKSIVKKGTELEKIIHVFEEKSRNYIGIDFSKAGGKKKVLITGFDPFILNQFDNPDFVGNILQSNPSGCVALSLNEINIGNCYIQTMIVPVRYTDFDGNQDNAKGQGEGIIEKYIKPWINQVDMIITISQYRPKENVIDMFGTSRRGGFNDNENFIRENGSQAVSTKFEWIQTTLPKTFSNAPFVKFNWKFDNVSHPENTVPKSEQILNEGSGGDYLSNEIFYRVGKMRSEIRPTLATGHFHIEKLQEAKQDLKVSEIERLLSIVKKGIEEGIKGI